MGGELIDDLRTCVRGRKQVAAPDIDLVGKRKGDGIACFGTFDTSVVSDNPIDTGSLAGSGNHDLVTGGDLAGSDRAGIAPEIQIRSIDPLNRKAERPRRQFTLDIDRLQVIQQCEIGVPSHVVGWRRDVVAIARRNRNRND